MPDSYDASELTFLDQNPAQKPGFKLGTQIIGKTDEGRPIIKNPDGSVSTELSITGPWGPNGEWINIPSIYNGRQRSEEEALKIIRDNGYTDPETGRKIPFYPNVADAEAAAQKRSSQDLSKYGGQNRGYYASDLQFLDEQQANSEPAGGSAFPLFEQPIARRLPSGKFEVIPGEKTPFNDPKRGRAALELLAAGATIPLTGGLGTGLGALVVRSALSGTAGAGASLLSETFDPTADRPAVDLGPEPEGIVAKIGRLLQDRGGPGSGAAHRAIETGAAFGAAELGGGLVGKGIARAARPFFRTVDPERVIAREAIRKGGGTLPLAQATGSRPARILQGIGESSTFGAGAIQKARTGAEEIANRQIDAFVEKFPERFGREELGGLIQDAVQGRRQAFLEAAEAAYAKVDDAFEAAAQKALGRTGAVVREGTRVTTEPVVSLAPVKRAARELLDRAREGLPGGHLRSVLREVLSKPDATTFRGAQRLRSDLLRVTRSGTELIGGQAQGASGRLAHLVHNSMRDTAKAAGGEVLEAWELANQGFRRGAQTFNSKLIRRVASEQPEAVLEALLRPNRPGSIRQARLAIGNEKIWQGIQREYLDRLLTIGAINRGTEQLSGQRLLTLLSKFGDSGNELLGKPNITALKELARNLKIVQEHTGIGAGGIMIRAGTEVSGLMLALTGRPVQGSALMLGPSAIGTAFSSPKTVRILTEGIKAPPGSAKAVQAFLQLSQILGRNASRDR